MEQLTNERISFSPEIILMILNRLNSLNVLLECRLVCRRWNELVKLIRIQTLQVGERHPNAYEMNTFSIDLNPTLFDTSRTDFMKSNSMKTTLLSRLKQVFFSEIKIKRKPDWLSFEKSLQQLGELEHLEINKLYFNRTRELSLPNLRILSIHNSYDGHIVLDLPNLSKLLITGEFSFINERPTAVTHLAFDVLTCRYFSIDQFVQHFPDCEYLYFIEISSMSDHLIFTHFPKLKEIHCERTSKEIILNLIKHLKVSRMLNVQIYLNGFSANEQDDVEELFGKGNRFLLTTQRILSNYHRLPRVVWMDVDLDYNQLVRHFDSKLPSDLYTKLRGRIQTLLIVGKVNDQAALLSFIEKFDPPNLEIKLTSLGPTSLFYENLHSFWTSRVSLRIEEQPGVITNLDFLTEFFYLEKFSINQQIPYNLIERMFKKFNKMELECLLNDQLISLVWSYNSGGYFCVRVSEKRYSYTKDNFLNAVRKKLRIV